MDKISFTTEDILILYLSDMVFNFIKIVLLDYRIIGCCELHICKILLSKRQISSQADIHYFHDFLLFYSGLIF